MSRKQTPSEFLKLIIGRPVVVKLNSGVDYRGNKKTRHEIKTITALKDNYSLLFLRCLSLSRWLHEHCSRADRRVRKWSIEE